MTPNRAGFPVLHGGVHASACTTHARLDFDVLHQRLFLQRAQRVRVLLPVLHASCMGPSCKTKAPPRMGADLHGCVHRACRAVPLAPSFPSPRTTQGERSAMRKLAMPLKPPERAMASKNRPRA